LEANNLNQLQQAKEDKTVDGIMLRLGIGGYSMARLQEMRDAVLDFRASGKKAICYMELAGNKEYYLAAACDKIVLNPAGYLALNGLRSEVTFYKDVLDKLGIEADLYHIGKYKSASEAFTREGMSDAYRESLNSFLDDISDQMVSGIAEGRGISHAEVKKRIDEGPYTAREAKEAALVDELVYADQLKEVAEQEFGKNAIKLSGKEYGNYEYHGYDWFAKPKLAVIYAAGIIAPGKSMFAEEASSFLSIPRIMGSETISKAVKKARTDDSIKAIVLRIDSGGGSVFASDVIWREVMLAKDKKPVIVSMGGVAASGGYYIACPADVIVAEPATVTGSIGIIGGKFSLRGFYDKLGIKKEIFKRGKNSDIYTMYAGFTDEQREIVNRQIREMYDDFVRKVAQGRNMAEETVESVAQGRVWTGKQAHDNGLVDELGGLQLAVSIAKVKADLKPDEDVEIVVFPKYIPLWRRFVSKEISFLSKPLNLAALLDAMKAVEGLGNDKIFFLTPYTLDCE
jgi:protease-4